MIKVIGQSRGLEEEIHMRKNIFGCVCKLRDDTKVPSAETRHELETVNK